MEVTEKAKLNNSEVLHSEIRQKDSARGSEVENAHEDSACLFGKSSLCRKYFSDEFSCRRALARDLFKEVSYLGIASPPSLATSASSATSDCSRLSPLHCLSTLFRLDWSILTVICVAEKTMAIRIKFDLAMELVFLR